MVALRVPAYAANISTTRTICLVLNDIPLDIERVAPSTTLLEYLRSEQQLTGTKEGCAEGDCGACTVVVADEGPGQTRAWRAINACIVPLALLHGKAVRTVEGLATNGTPHPVQQAMVDALGSQCGYCTPGVVMSLFEAYYRRDGVSAAALDDQLCGNLCRCTGYRPIRDAAAQLAGCGGDDRFTQALHQTDGLVEELSYGTADECVLVPTSLDGLWRAMADHPEHRLVAGATDLGLEITLAHRRFACLISLEHIAELRQWDAGPRIVIGAGLRLSELESLARDVVPVLTRMLRFFGSRQIKNRATIGGNLCHASPVGDLAPVMLALDALFVVRSSVSTRLIPATEFFTGYRQTALRPGDILERIEFVAPAVGDKVGAYKVSKRRELDISTVNAAFWLQLDTAGRVAGCRMAFGGLDAVPRRSMRLEDALVGRPWTEATVEQAVDELTRDFAPIDDVRGSAAYRLAVAQNLVRGFWYESQRSNAAELPSRPSSTLVVDEVPSAEAS